MIKFLMYFYNSTPFETAKYIGSGLIDDNLITIRNGKGYFYHKDHLGSITAITTDTGEVMQKNTYSSFGKILSIKDKERKELGFAKALEQPFYYTGREWDEEIELYYYRARNYNPSTGRFLSKDPIGLKGGDSNMYRYVSNNPINRNDPEGLLEQDVSNALQFVQMQDPFSPRNTTTYFVPDKLLKGNNALALPGLNVVLLNEKYEQILSRNAQEGLIRTMFHEQQHLKDATYFPSEERHNEIYRESENFYNKNVGLFRDLYGNDLNSGVCK